MKVKIHNHASVVLVYNENKILSNIYDYTYPKEIWRGRINLLGGGQDRGDISPRLLLEREIREEFTIKPEGLRRYDSNFSDIVGSGSGAPKISKFSSKIDIDLVKNSVLKNLRPYKDFLVSFPCYRDRPAFNVIFSVYISKIPLEVIDCVKKNLKENKSLISEGFLRITNLEELKSGKVLAAWATGKIIEDYFKIKVLDPEGLDVKVLGAPKNSLKEYFEDYDYGIK